MTMSLGRTGPVEAVIFDMDGLLLDTEALAMRALADAAGRMGLDAPQAFLHSLIGVPADQCRRMARDHGGPNFPVEAYFELADHIMVAAIEAGELPRKPGVQELLTWLEERHVPKAVATSSSRAKAEHHLRLTGIRDSFAAVISRTDVERGKPFPDVYLRAAESLGVPPAGCLAVEDSYNGVRAAHAAGMRVVMVPDLLDPTDEMRAICVVVVPDLHVLRELLRQADTDEPWLAGAEAA